MGIAVGDLCVNGCNQLRDTAKHLATNLFGRQVAKDTFNQLEPRSTGQGEVHVNTRVARQPRLNRGVFVHGVIVGDQMDGLALGDLAINQTKEPQPFLVPMARQVEMREPSATLRAAKSVVVPWRLSSWVSVPQRSFFLGKPGWVQSTDWIWLF